MFTNQEVPAYLQGSQTGAILQGTQQAATGNYTPGYGQAPTPAPSDPWAYDGSHDFGTDTWKARVLSKMAQQRNSFNDQNYTPNGGALNTYPGGGSTSTPSGTSGGTTGGTSGIPTTTTDPWMTPEQMRDATNSLGSISSGVSGGGSTSYGGGGSSSQLQRTSTTTGGGALGGLLTPTNSNTSPQVNSSPFQVNSPIGYMSPSGQVQTNPAGAINMQQANPQNAMQQYQGSLGYQLLGNDQTNQYQQSPGYQYAVNEALKQVQQNAASRGLLESGSALRAMTDRAQGMAQQDYGNWWNRHNQLYSDYQNRLAGLAGGPTGSQDAMALGQSLGANSTQMGSNLGSLFANQGNAGMGGIINTGAAQSSNMTNAGAQQAMINQANQSTQLAGAVNSGLF